MTSPHGTVVPTTPADPLDGRLVDGRYEVRGRIARGGMATVYRAHDRRLDRDIALKVMHPHLAEDPEFVARFEREARAAGRLSHPHVVAVHDQGDDAGVLYLAMELVEGPTLRTLLRRERALTVRAALDIVEDVLRALDGAHGAGLVHRDIKPENVLLSSGSRALVADFGLARAIGTTTASATGTLLGTVAYISPELVTSGRADIRSDLYSLGVMAYEMLTGAQPFRGDLPVQVAFQHVHEDLPKPSARTTSVPGPVDAMVAWCCARNPAERPDSAGQLLVRLREMREDLTDAELDAAPRPAEDVDPVEQETSEVPRSTSAIDREAVAAAAAAGAAGATTGGPEATSDTVAVPAPAGASPGGARRPRRRLALVLLPLLLLAALGGWWGLAGPGSRTAVPDLAGLTLAQAERQLAEADLGVRTTTVFSATVAEGSVVRTSPAAGTPVDGDQPVLVTLSAGGESATLPSLTGLSPEQASSTLTALGLEPVTGESVNHPAIAEGLVVSTDPAEGAVPRGSEVTLTLSAGPDGVPVPAVLGDSVAQARAQVTEAGLVLRQAGEEHSPTAPAGTVLRQDPADGQLAEGEVVSVVVSLGPRPVDVPHVEGLAQSAAEGALRSVDLVPVVTTVHSGTAPEGVVADQENPEAPVLPGDRVVLEISLGPRPADAPTGR